MPQPHSTALSLSDLQAVLNSLGALRQGRALGLLLGTMCLTGLFMASVEPALAAERNVPALLWLAAAALSLLVGVNATGWLLMQEMLGKARDLDGFDAVQAALRQTHRTLAVLLFALAPLLPFMALLLIGLWAAQMPWVGAPLLAVFAPLSVLLAAFLALVLLVLVGPLAGPAIWSGAGVRDTARWLRRQARERLIEATLLKLALLGLVTGVTGVLTLAVLTGARVLAVATWLVDLPVPPKQVVAHLFGYTLKALGASGAPVVANSQAMALSIGGGILLALLVVLPTLVYLRGCCAIYLRLHGRA